MAVTNFVDQSRGLIRATDTGTNNPRSSGGELNLDATDYLSVTGNATARGIALAAVNDGETPTAIPLTLAYTKSTISTKTADYSVLASDSGKTFSTTGAAGTVVFALPAAVPGLKYRFYVGAVQELRIDPNGTETAGLPSSGVQQAAGAYLTANAIGETLDLECVVAGTWSPFGYSGTWTAV